MASCVLRPASRVLLFVLGALGVENVYLFIYSFPPIRIGYFKRAGPAVSVSILAVVVVSI